MDKIPDKALSFASATIGTFLMFFDTIAIEIRIIIFIVSIAISLFVQALSLYYIKKKLESELDKISQNHKALSKQFEEKQHIIKKYEQASIFIEQLLGQTVATTKEFKFNKLRDDIMFHLYNINRSD